MTFADVAFASGFASVRQFNDTVREVYDASPTQLRAARRTSGGGGLLAHSRAGCARGHPGPAAGRPDAVRRRGDADLPGRARRRRRGGGRAGLVRPHARAAARPRARPGRARRRRDRPRARPLPADGRRPARRGGRGRAGAADAGRRLRPARGGRLARRRPGAGPAGAGPSRPPGARARRRARGRRPHRDRPAGLGRGRLDGDRAAGGALRRDRRRATGPGRLFPDAATLAGLDVEELPMPRSRGRALVALCRALADGEVALDRSDDRELVRTRLLDLPGIGPWTADYVGMRALGHPDVFLPSDIGVRNALAGLGLDPATVAARAERWRPWRSYALLHLWSTLPMLQPDPDPDKGELTCGPRSNRPWARCAIVEHDGAVTAIEFVGPRPAAASQRSSVGRRRRTLRRPAGRRPRRRRHPARRDGAPADGVLRPRPQGVRPAAAARGHRLPAAGVAAAAGRSATARPRRTARSPGASG